MLIEGVSCSFRRDVEAAGLFSCGGGDRRRGETGHRGLSLGSVVTMGFRGVGASIAGSCGAGRVGVGVDDRLLEEDGAGMLDLI